MLGQPDSQRRHEYLYWEFPAYGGQQAVRMGDWKGIRQNMLRRENKQPLKIELYNLAEDVGEESDVAEEVPKVTERIRKIMRTARRPSEQFPFKPLDEQR